VLLHPTILTYKMENREPSLPNRTTVIWASKSGGFHKNWEVGSPAIHQCTSQHLTNTQT